MRLGVAPSTRHLKVYGFLQTPTILLSVQQRQLSHFVHQPSRLIVASHGKTTGFVTFGVRFGSHEQTAKDLNQRGVDQALSDFDATLGEEKEKQTRAPWHRQGADIPPVRRQRSAGAMTKGKCTCTWPNHAIRN